MFYSPHMDGDMIQYTYTKVKYTGKLTKLVLPKETLKSELFREHFKFLYST